MPNPNFAIAVQPEKCSGCRMCALACAQLHERRFQPSLARVRVTAGPDFTMSIDFDERCLHCGTCADHCFYGALKKTRREAP